MRRDHLDAVLAQLLVEWIAVVGAIAARWRCNHLGERAELRQQVLCRRLDVPARYGVQQDQLEHFIVVERIAATLQEPLAQAAAGNAALHLLSGFCRCRAWMYLRGALARAPARGCPLRPILQWQHAYAGTEGRGRSRPCGDSVKISTPPSVTATVCSNWAESERSRVTAVQPSESTFTCGRPRLIIGSTVKNMPGRSTMPSPGRPTCTMLGSS